MNKTEHLLTALMKECAEIQEACAVSLSFGLDDVGDGSESTNAQRIEKAFLEALAVRDLLRDTGAITRTANAANIYSEKRQSIARLIEYAESRGTLQIKSSVADRKSHSEPLAVIEIKQIVAAKYNLSVESLISASRRNRYILPRWIAMSLTRSLTNLSLAEIGDAFMRDHTTIMHGIQRLDQIRQSKPEFDAEYKLLLAQAAQQRNAATS